MNRQKLASVSGLILITVAGLIVLLNPAGSHAQGKTDSAYADEKAAMAALSRSDWSIFRSYCENSVLVISSTTAYQEVFEGDLQGGVSRYKLQFPPIIFDEPQLSDWGNELSRSVTVSSSLDATEQTVRGSDLTLFNNLAALIKQTESYRINYNSSEHLSDYPDASGNGVLGKVTSDVEWKIFFRKSDERWKVWLIVVASH